MKDLGLKSLGTAKALFSCLAVFAVFCMMSLSSCSNAISDSELGVNTSDDAFALANFAKVNQVLVDSLMANSSIGNDCNTLDSAEFVGLVDKVQENMASALRGRSSVKDATRSGSITKEEIIYGDVDSLLAYVKENASSDFYEFVKSTANYERVSLSETDVIKNESLSYNEKVGVLSVLPVLNYDERILPEKMNAQSKDPCLAKYKSMRASCMRQFAVDAVLLSWTCAAMAIVDVLWAWYNLDDCLDDALYHYRQCK